VWILKVAVQEIENVTDWVNSSVGATASASVATSSSSRLSPQLW
jgi:hypothetical protein